MIYSFLMSADGPVTQGQREVVAEHEAELKKLGAVWMRIVNDELPRFNQTMRDLGLPSVAIPPPGQVPPRPLLMKRRS